MNNIIPILFVILVIILVLLLVTICVKNKVIKYKGGKNKKYGGNKNLDIIKRSVGYAFFGNKTDRPTLDILLTSILEDNQIDTFLSSGTTKLVFLIKDNPNLIFKIIILNYSMIQRFICEPIFMLTSPYCNSPININLYINIDKILFNCDNININNTTSIGDYIIITWFEEKALISELSNMKDQMFIDGTQFKIDTTAELTSHHITDLGDVNIGFFESEPHFRWFDAQPDISSHVDCLKIK